jgi:hypothetical protein
MKNHSRVMKNRSRVKKNSSRVMKNHSLVKKRIIAQKCSEVGKATWKRRREWQQRMVKFGIRRSPF